MSSAQVPVPLTAARISAPVSAAQVPAPTEVADAGIASVEIAHVDAGCIVAVKPAGLLSVPGRGDAGRDCLAARLQVEWPDALVVHRLDMATSGLMVFARGAAAQRALSLAFAERDVKKRYVAVVDGRMPADAGTIDLPLLADWPNRPKQKVDALHGKPSLTRYRVLQRITGGRAADVDAGGSDCTRVELEPVTGRAHQLRVHLLALGHPILGDALYAPAAAQARSPRLLLHATHLDFARPGGAGRVTIESRAPF